MNNKVYREIKNGFSFGLIFFLANAALSTSFANEKSHAEDSVAESAKELGRDTKKEVKKGVRHVKDKTCRWVHGKLECAAKKAKHKAQNAVDEMKDKADDVKLKQ